MWCLSLIGDGGTVVDGLCEGLVQRMYPKGIVNRYMHKAFYKRPGDSQYPCSISRSVIKAYLTAPENPDGSVVGVKVSFVFYTPPY